MALGFISKYGIFKKLLILQASSCVQFQCWRKSMPLPAWASKSELKYFSTLRNIYTFDKQNSSADSWLGETLGCDFPYERTVPCPKGSCFLILKILKRPYLKIYKIKLAPVQYLGLFCVVFLYWDPSPSLNTWIPVVESLSFFFRLCNHSGGWTRQALCHWAAG